MLAALLLLLPQTSPPPPTPPGGTRPWIYVSNAEIGELQRSGPPWDKLLDEAKKLEPNGALEIETTGATDAQNGAGDTEVLLKFTSASGSRAIRGGQTISFAGVSGVWRYYATGSTSYTSSITFQPGQTKVVTLDRALTADLADATLVTHTIGGTLDDINNNHDAHLLAGALVYRGYKHIVPTNPTTADYWRDLVQDGIYGYLDDTLREPKTDIIWNPAADTYGQLTAGPFHNSRTALAPSRNIWNIVVAANLLEWNESGARAGQKATFSDFCRLLIGTSPTPPFDAWDRFTGGFPSIPYTNETRPNNWGAMAGASRMAMALFLKDYTHYARVRDVFAGYMAGPGSSYNGFTFDVERSWHESPSGPLYAVNPPGAVAWDGSGRNFDGILTDDQRRGVCTGSCPDVPYSSSVWDDNAGVCIHRPGYVWEAGQGLVLQAIMCERRGSAGFGYATDGLKRVFAWIVGTGGHSWNEDAADDDRWMAFALDEVYGTSHAAAISSSNLPTKPGKMGGFTDWLVTGSTWLNY